MCRFIEVDWAKVFLHMGHFLSKPFPGIITQSEMKFTRVVAGCNKNETLKFQYNYSLQNKKNLD